MTRKELSRRYWKYYRMLEGKLLESADYVEIDQRNFQTFSNEYALLLQAIGAELDNFFKAYCGFNPTDRKNIADYAGYILQEFPGITTASVKINGTDIWLAPFQNWNTATPAQSLTWWEAFADIKHNRVGNFTEANQENVLNAMCALYLLELRMFTKATEDDGSLAEVDIPPEDSKLFLLPKWKFRSIEVTDEILKYMEY